MALAVTNIIFTLPLSIYEVVSNTDPNAIVPWRSWAEVHSNFSLVNQYPAALWNADPAHAIPLQLTRWTTPLCALVFFAYFGFAEEARKHYSNAFKATRDRFYRRWTARSSSRYVFLCLPSSFLHFLGHPSVSEGNVSLVQLLPLFSFGT